MQNPITSPADSRSGSAGLRRILENYLKHHRVTHSKELGITGVYAISMGNKTMSIRVGDRRERLFDRLEVATGEATRAGALEAAARYYCHMDGAVAEGAVEELMQLALKEGSVRPEQIADVLDHQTLPVGVTIDVDVGVED